MKRFVSIAAALCASFVAPATRASAQSGLAEESVKAAFLSRFASFVEWPSGAFVDEQQPIRLCAVGAGLAGALEPSVAGQTAAGRKFEVQRLSDAAAARQCHIVFVTGALVDETLRDVRGLPVLTVTDAASGGERGMVHFAIVNDHVRFHIDDARAAESGLFISSRLLSLAVSVRRRA